MDKQLIINEALKLKDIPYHHQGRNLSGLDCAGLIVLTAKNLGIYPEKVNPDYTGYSMIPDGRQLYNVFKKYCFEKDKNKLEPGDILLMRFKDNPQHVAIYLGDYLNNGQEYFIHSHMHAKKVVVDHLNNYWKNKIISSFEFIDIKNLDMEL